MVELLHDLEARNEGPILLDLEFQRSLQPAWGPESYRQAIEPRVSSELGAPRGSDPRSSRIVVRRG